MGDFQHAFALVITGAIKVFVLAYPLERSADVFAFYGTNSVWIIWFELVLFAWYFYLNFAGYSDMSIGVARLFGYQLKPNFNMPYFRSNPQEFWNNWHMSLTRFAQRNVFIPLGGMRANRQYVAITATIMVIALWHDISWALVIFGVYHACALVGWRVLTAHRPATAEPGLAGRIAKPVGVFTFVMLSLPMLVLEIDEFPDFYSSLVGRS